MTNILFDGFVVGAVVFGVLASLFIASIGIWVVTLMMSNWVDSYIGYDEKNQKGGIS